MTLKLKIHFCEVNIKNNEIIPEVIQINTAESDLGYVRHFLNL